jgi:metal-responsive CopG/Arc/MetJ family transcriptional regulator
MIGEDAMATVNFSVPEDVKREFDKAFAGRNKSRVIADLMAQAIEEQHVQKRRSKAIDALLARRRTKRPVTAKQISRAREAGRP